MPELIFLIGGLVALWGFEAWLRHRGPCLHPCAKRAPWYYYGIIAVLFTVRQIQTGAFSPLLTALVTCALAYMAWEFYKQCPQFSIRGMLLAMSLVAVVCSASRYVDAIFTIPVLLAFLEAWNRYRSGQYNRPTTEMTGQVGAIRGGDVYIGYEDETVRATAR